MPPDTCYCLQVESRRQVRAESGPPPIGSDRFYGVHDPPNPHVVMLVPNVFTADARAQKTARTLARAGLRVTVLASKLPEQPAQEQDEGVTILRLPMGKLAAAWTDRPRRFGYHYTTQTELRMHEHRQKLVERDIRVAIARFKAGRDQSRAGEMRSLTRASERPFLFLLTSALRLWLRAWRIADALRRPPKPRRQRWGHAAYLEFELAFGPLIEELQPDVIHAHNTPMIPIAARAAWVSAGEGRPTPWIYDAHEYAAGLAHLPQDLQTALVGLERQFVSHAAAVITVSPILAERLRADHGLDSVPDVVLNTPSCDRAPLSGPGIRTAIGIESSDPLLVYSGNINEHRGVRTLVQAMPLLKGVHVALVVPTDKKAVARYVKELTVLAKKSGCAERLHIMPFVSSEHVPDYLSEADIAILPLVHYGNAEIALTNKLFEYLHARLPIVASDCAAQAEFIRNHGVGEVFLAEDPGDLARAVVDVLDNVDRYQQRITPSLLRRYSWEHEERTLLGVYRRLLDDRTPQAN